MILIKNLPQNHEYHQLENAFILTSKSQTQGKFLENYSIITYEQTVALNECIIVVLYHKE